MPQQIVVNLLPISTGGGKQNALSFLEILAKNSQKKREFHILSRENSEIHRKCLESGIAITTIKNHLYARLNFELNCRKHFSKGQVCFTFFGPPMLASCNYLINVVGCAYSNLFYPEIPFWHYLPWFQRNKKNIIDFYRKYVTIQGDYWIFETPILRKRAIELCNFPSERIGVVRMAPSELVSQKKIKPELTEKFENKLPSSFRFLFLSGSHPNKRQHLLMAIARRMIDNGFRRFSFVTTMDTKDTYARNTIDSFQRNGLSEFLVNLGPIPSSDVATLINCCDAMCSFSVLESFSNNFVEAWRMEKPLIVGDTDWARDACGEGAVYVEPTDAAECAAELIKVASDSIVRIKKVEFGKIQLNTYPTAEQKNMDYYNQIEIAARKGFCPKEERGKIKWPAIT